MAKQPKKDDFSIIEQIQDFRRETLNPTLSQLREITALIDKGVADGKLGTENKRRGRWIERFTEIARFEWYDTKKFMGRKVKEYASLYYGFKSGRVKIDDKQFDLKLCRLFGRLEFLQEPLHVFDDLDAGIDWLEDNASLGMLDLHDEEEIVEDTDEVSPPE